MRGMLLFAALLAASAQGVAGAAADAQLFAALHAEDPETALYALAQGADPRATEPDGTTPLHYAAHQADIRLVEALLKAKVDPNARNEFGATPLAEAATTGDAAVIGLLLKAGADVESANPEGQTALMVVARTGRVDAAKLLLRHGADVNAKEQWGGQNALMWASAQGHPEMIRLLLKAGADPNSRGAIRDWQRRVTSEPRPKGMNRGGFTPLLYAAREGCIDCARELLAGGADINRADPEQTTPLVLALMNLRFAMADFLIDAGADVDRWDLYGQTPLYVAIDMNTLPRGGRPDLPSEDATSGLDVARHLLMKGANPNIPLKLRPPYRNYIFDRGGDQILSTGATPLLRAAKGGDVEAVRLLIGSGASIGLANDDGITPLMVAAGMGHGANPTRGRYKTDAQAVECTRLLIEAGGQVNGAARNQRTALHAAAAQGWDETVRLLVSSGADLEATDARGLRPIDHAAGRYERAFLEPEPVPRASTMKLLHDAIVASTGREPIQFKGPKPGQTQGTAGAGSRNAFENQAGGGPAASP
jgi:ankyrin repeat protein